MGENAAVAIGDVAALTQCGVFTYETFQPLVAAEPTWLVKGLIPDKSVNLLIGNSGLGKTPLGITLGISVASGMDFFGHPVAPGRVLYCDAESTKHDFNRIVGSVSRTMGLDKPPPDFLFWSPYWTEEPSENSPAMDLLKVVVAVKPKLVFVDTLRTFWPHADQKSEVAVGMFRDMRKTGASWIVKRLNEITTEDVQQLKAALGAKKKSPKTVNNILSLLNVVLRTAVEWQLIEQLPCVIRWVRTTKSEVQFHDFEAFARLVNAAKVTDWQTHLVVLLGGEAGLRCGEMMALEWKDLDFGHGLHGQMCVARSEWKGHVTATKGGRVRYVPMTSRLAEALKAVPTKRGRLLRDAKGQPLTQKEVQGIMKRVARAAGVRHGVHILRHTFCSHLAMRAAPARAIQELAGHNDLATTQRYMHLSPAALDRAIELLDMPTPVLRGATGEAAGTGGQNSQTY